MATTGEPFGLFWDSDGGDRTYSADSWERWLKKFFTSGVFNGDLQVSASSGMTLEVGAGYTNANGKVKFWNAPFNVTLDAANSTYPRIDTVVIRRDNVNRQITCEKVTGQYSGDTPQPTAPTRNNEIYELVLAQILVPAGSTEVIGSNITDTRPDTSLCGYITGTVEELDFSAFTAQFEAYFAEFKSQHEHEWSVWETAQRAAYAAWFATVQAQQVQDKADWDAWYAALQEELHELPPDTAEYLQIEIDEIRQSGTSGSILNITTTESSLEGKTITVTNGTEVRTGVFDENLECVIAGYKGVGEVTISASDGIDTATTVVNIPYFGNYTYNIAFWAATVNIQGDDNLKGATITVKDSDDLTVDTVVLNVVTGQGVFTATKADTYTFNFTFQGTDYSEELVVDEETTYSLELSAGFDWRGWVDTAQFLDSTDYNNLDEVLADELAVRELCLEHACVDYLADIATANEVVETIINNDLFAKWVNNSDYALDFLGANVVIKALMDEADKYGYGEWVITDNTTTPPTWGAKGNVPVMTANNAPYGVASAASTLSGYDAYKAFDNNPSTYFASNDGTTGAGQRLVYKFVNPVNVKRLYHKAESSATETIKVQYSDDGTTWTDTGDTFTNTSSDGGKYVDVTDSGYHLYWAIAKVSSTSSSRLSTYTLQFYGRELKGTVPKMTSNTAPYGTVIYSTQNSSYLGYYAFDDAVSGNGWTPNTNDSFNNAYIGYTFLSPICIKRVRLYMQYNYTETPYPTATVKIQGSNDGTNWDDLSDVISLTAKQVSYVDLDNDNKYLSYRMRLLSTDSGAVSRGNGYHVQFYDSGYSEKEFETGTTKKWLYDHGVELETMIVDDSRGATIVKESDGVYLYDSGADKWPIIAHNVNVANYSLFRAKLGEKYYDNGTGRASALLASVSSIGGASVATKYLYNYHSEFPNNINLDISSDNTSSYVEIAIQADNSVAAYAKFTELWLE